MARRTTPSTEGTSVIKATGASKGKAQKMSDHAQPRGDFEKTDNAHPSQRGGANGLRHTLPDGNIRKGKKAGVGRSAQGLVKGSKESTSRSGTSRSGARSRRAVRKGDEGRQRRSPGR